MDESTMVLMGAVIIISIIFTTLATLLIKRNQNRFSYSIAMYFITATLGLIINVVYRVVNNFNFNIIGNLITIYLTAFGGIFLLDFNLLLVKSTKLFSKRKQLMVNLLYGLILSGLVIIQIITKTGIKWTYGIPTQEFSINNPPTESQIMNSGNPVYSPLFGLYGLFVSQFIFVIIIVTAVKIKRKMGSNIYGKKYIRNIIGILFFDLTLIFAFVTHLLNDDLMREISKVIQLAIIPGALFLYSGLKKAPE